MKKYSINIRSKSLLRVLNAIFHLKLYQIIDLKCLCAVQVYDFYLFRLTFLSFLAVLWGWKCEVFLTIPKNLKICSKLFWYAQRSQYVDNTPDMLIKFDILTSFWLWERARYLIHSKRHKIFKAKNTDGIERTLNIYETGYERALFDDFPINLLC